MAAHARSLARMRDDATTTRGPRRFRGEDGYILAMVGLLIVPLIVVTAFATDVGQWYGQATQMQRTADAAALAGVVWIGDKVDPDRYRDEAAKVARQNGYGPGETVNGETVDVDIDLVPPNRLRVTVSARAQTFFGGAGGVTEQHLTRSAVAEFNQSVPLGSPRNYLGLGDRGSTSSTYRGTAFEREGIWMAVSGRCTDKAQGDRIAAWTEKGGGTNNCDGATNSEYDDPPYELYIDLPTTRSYSTQVIIYNGNFSAQSDCVNVDTDNPTREFCPGGGLVSGVTRTPTTFTLYQADSTPLDDTDNPRMDAVGGCSSAATGLNGTKTFNGRTDGLTEHNIAFNPGSGFAGNTSNVTGAQANAFWNMCTIPFNAPGGRYILRVRPQANTDGTVARTHGSNAYGVIANRSNNSALCDSRTETTCPRVYAKDYLSVYATNSGQPEFFLAEIGREHAGKRVEITLWDPAEGAEELRIRRPLAGCSGGGSWADQRFDWSVDGVTRGTNTDRIDVSGTEFNNKAIVITFRLPTDYNPPDCNKWYRIRYTFGGTATDRTTWSLEILGDPVHLVE